MGKDVPPFIGVDQEGGCVTRLPEPYTRFPDMACVGQNGTVSMAYEVGAILDALSELDNIEPHPPYRSFRGALAAELGRPLGRAGRTGIGVQVTGIDRAVGLDADLVIVVGSANSSNTVRLVEVALDAGAKSAYRVDDATEIQESWFEGVKTVGVSSGASVPEDLVSVVLDYLDSKGFGNVSTVTTAEEDIQFSLPKELRKDLKQAGHDTSNKKR